MMSFFQRPIARHAGLALSLAATGYLIWLALGARDSLAALDVIHIFPGLLLASVSYAAICILIGTAWYLLFHMLEPNVLSWPRCVSIYANSQVAKYLPTNTLHFVGRFAMGRAAGASSQALVSSTVFEQSLVLCVAIVLGIFVLPSVFEDVFYRVSPQFPVWLYALISAALLGFGFIVRRKIFAVFSMISLPHVGGAATLIFLFFLSTAGLFLFLGADLLGAGQHMPSFIWTTSVVALAWAVGMLIPGASAGIGLREIVIISALNTDLPTETVLSIALAFRIMTISGDALLFVAGIFLHKRLIAELP